jgi:hypothetical protein
MKKIALFWLIAALGLSVCAASGSEGVPAAPAGPFEKAFAAFTSAAAAKDHAKALAALRSLMASFWSESALLLENVRFVKGADNSFGMYEPRGSDAFSDGEPIYLYAEPAGYVIKKNPAGYFEFGFKADFQVADESGKVLGGQNDFAVMPFKSWNANTEVSITFTYTLSGLDKGRYRIITQVSDVNSKKKSSCEKWFTIN